MQFNSASDLLILLNGTFNNTYEYEGVWSISGNHLLFSNPEDCGNNDYCIIINTGAALLQENNFDLLQENGFKILI